MNTDETCWFCKIRPASPSNRCPVGMYRVLSREDKYIVVGMSHKQTYETLTEYVPRCDQCLGTHTKSEVGYLAAWIGLSIWASVWASASSGKGDNESIFTAIIGIVLTFIMCGVPVGFSRMIIDSFWKSPDQAASHPRIIQLVKAGWVVGDKPPYK